MTTALRPDAQKTPESTSLPSPPVDHPIADRPDLALNLDLNAKRSESSEVTSRNVTTSNVTAAFAPPHAGISLKVLDPKKISIGDMPNRTPESYKGEAYEHLCQSMAAQGGNTQPIQVRVLSPAEMSVNAGYTHQLVSGERRLRAAATNGQLVQAIVFEGLMTSDAQLVTLTENLSREDLSPFEWGRQLQYLTQQNPGYSMSRLAQLSGRDKSVVCRAIELASLPVEIVAAFTSIRDLRYADAKPLLTAYRNSPDNVIVEAALIVAEAAGLKGPAVVKRLVAASEGGVAPCNTTESISIRFEDRVVGQLSTTKTGGSQILLQIEISDQQRKALAAHIEKFVCSRVLRASDMGAEKSSKKTWATARPAKSESTSLGNLTAQNDA